MPPLVFDFADIASRLRRDDFYTPTPKAEEVHVGFDLAMICPRCSSQRISKSRTPQCGFWYCKACNWFFS